MEQVTLSEFGGVFPLLLVVLEMNPGSHTMDSVLRLRCLPSSSSSVSWNDHGFPPLLPGLLGGSSEDILTKSLETSVAAQMGTLVSSTPSCLLSLASNLLV